jgi:hypothetical protein
MKRLAALTFALAYPQAALYTSNQNTYFLHGLMPHATDWQANTLDPFPLFTLLVQLTAAIHPALFHLEYAALLALYFYNLLELAEIDHPIPAFMLMVAHLPFIPYSFLFTSGLADQYLLGPTFQPSNAGIFLIVAINQAKQGHDSRALLIAVLAPLFHVSYLLPFIYFFLGHVILNGAKRSEESLKMWPTQAVFGPDKLIFRSKLQGLFASLRVTWLILLLALAFILFTLYRFRPTANHAEAMKILAHVRFPHHALPEVWWWWGDYITLGLITYALWLAKQRDNKLYYLLMTLVLPSVTLTLAYLVSHNLALALLFPWRVSVILVPISTALIVRHFVPPLLGRRGAGGEVAFVCLALLGLTLSLTQAAPHYNDVPSGTYLIPPELEDFRLATHNPVYIDFKSHPFQDDEVLAWATRLRQAKLFYATHNCGLIPKEVTHILISSGQPQCKGVTFVKLSRMAD